MTDDISKQNTGDKAGQRDWSADEQWHIENATTDLSQFMRPVSIAEVVGEAFAISIDDVEVSTPEGEQFRLADTWRGRPVLLFTGSLSCPLSRLYNPAINDLREEFGDRINMAVLYVIDAHPSGAPCPYTGTDWLTKDNQEAGLLVRQPSKQNERNALATKYREQLGLKVPVLVDNMENTAWKALGCSPNIAVLIDKQGQCGVFQDWVEPDTLRELLHEYLK
ncbi:MAG: redoxin domain-containing protein [Gammaproteobacteria bacterium]|nr:redoxin domain-containing protein [Gammaproteobacteria bacterium]MCP4088287.1 redoxin domain-containing protein [Gammaproteobacteria bacterium]MCP4276402.1 redoxin domain-containing protein [Gammaproteobacteria bacterium]MCP4831049.1 redoxin domain-containing protein [Gammaproteobacteria bacterium]MCP4927430.1 redoxin domain-containing protein [Gammaproteobacteria bacterium]